jgi:hypothetical protein
MCGWTDGARRARLLLEAADQVLVAIELAPQHLHRHLPAQRHVLRQVHHPHRAATQLAQDAVARVDHVPHRQRQVRLGHVTILSSG